MSHLTTTDLDVALSRLVAGGLVAVPTETVYGLAADASSEEAVERIYRVKGRPSSHPVIVHVASIDAARMWTRRVPEWAERLADTFWPGPLTLVLPRAIHVGDYLTGSQDTIGLRVPGHPLTLSLLSLFGDGVAAPSANRFGSVSPTSADDVATELSKFLDPERDCILDGGRCPVGIESTIVDATGEWPLVLRPGAISAEAITAVAGREVQDRPSAIRAPGLLESHYSPRARVIVCESPELADVVQALGALDVALLAMDDVQLPDAPVTRLAAPTHPDEYARVLYAALRRADDLSMDSVVVVPPPDHGIGVAIRDRLRRASANNSASNASSL